MRGHGCPWALSSANDDRQHAGGGRIQAVDDPAVAVAEPLSIVAVSLTGVALATVASPLYSADSRRRVLTAPSWPKPDCPLSGRQVAIPAVRSKRYGKADTDQ